MSSQLSQHSFFRNFLRGIALSFVSVLIFLLLAEIICRIFFPDKQLRYMSDSETLARFAPNQEGWLTIADATSSFLIKINDLGFRDTDSNTWSKRRILFLGDSFTFGWGVLEDQKYTSVLQRAFGPELKIANGGQPGFGMYQIQATLNRVEAEIKPELVVIVIWEGLLARQPLSTEEKNEFIRKSSLIRSAKSISVFGTHLYRRLETLLSQRGMNQYIVTMSAGGGSTSEFNAKLLQLWQQDAQRILEMKDHLAEQNIQLAVVLWPRAGFSEASNFEASLALETEVANFTAQQALPFLSLRPSFQNYSKTLLILPKDYHPTILAHCLAAKSLSEFLTTLQYPPQQPITCDSTASNMATSSRNSHHE